MVVINERSITKQTPTVLNVVNGYIAKFKQTVEYSE